MAEHRGNSIESETVTESTCLEADARLSIPMHGNEGQDLHGFAAWFAAWSAHGVDATKIVGMLSGFAAK